MSSRGIERSIRAAGLRVSRSHTILPMMAAIRGLEAAGSAIRFIPKGNVINVNKLPFAITNTRRAFSYRVRLRGFYPNGEQIERFITISSDRGDLTPGQIESMAQDAVDLGGANYPFQLSEVTLQHGMQAVSPLIQT